MKCMLSKIKIFIFQKICKQTVLYLLMMYLHFYKWCVLVYATRHKDRLCFDMCSFTCTFIFLNKSDLVYISTTEIPLDYCRTVWLLNRSGKNWLCTDMLWNSNLFFPWKNSALNIMYYIINVLRSFTSNRRIAGLTSTHLQSDSGNQFGTKWLG